MYWNNAVAWRFRSKILGTEMPRYDGWPPNLVPRWLSRQQAAWYAGLSPNKFNTLVEQGKFPRPVQIGRRKLWDLRSLDSAMDLLAERGRRSEVRFNPWDAEND